MSETLEADNLVTRAFSMTTFRTPDEVFTTAYKASTVSGNTIAFNVRSPSNSALMSSVAYLRLRVRVTGSAAVGLMQKAALGHLSAGKSHFAKSDCFPVQCYACNSSTLTINGTSMNYNPSECLREILTSNIHKDALSKICNPVYDYSQGGVVYAKDGRMWEQVGDAGGGLAHAAERLVVPDRGFAQSCEEMADQMSSKLSGNQDANGYEFSSGN
jgi:hypothetical protein